MTCEWYEVLPLLFFTDSIRTLVQQRWEMTEKIVDFFYAEKTWQIHLVVMKRDMTPCLNYYHIWRILEDYMDI